MVGLYVRPSAFPNFSHPNRKGWFRTITAFSPTTASNGPYISASGANVEPVVFGTRVWNKTVPPGRTAPNSLDLTTPSYKLAGTDTTKDSVVGIDHYYPPLDLSRFIRVQAYGDMSDEPNSTFMRVLAIQHHFKIRNFSRFPLCIYYSVFPVGYEPEDLNTAAPLEDLSYSSYKKVTIPGVGDAGNKPRTGDINITMNLEKLFPDAYELPPEMKGGDSTGTADNSASPWVRVGDNHISSQYLTCPPGQSTQDPVLDTAVLAHTHSPALRLKMYSKLDTSMYLGDTLVGTAADGDTDTNGFTINASMNWLVNFVNMVQNTTGHIGTKAYPNQDA